MALLFVGVTLVSCCLNVVLLEVLLREVPGCANLITFSQFLFIAIEGFIFTSKFGTVRPVVPIKNYVVLVVMFFAVSVSNNWALNFNIPMPLHMIFKSGSLVTSMLLGMLILKKRYTMIKYISVLMVSIGIFLATIASQTTRNGTESDNGKGSTFIGILLLSFSLVLSALLGIYQETLFSKYGKHPREALFYSHALPLPGFAMLSSDILHFIPLLSKSANVQIFSSFDIPKLWLCLLGNVITQYCCVRSVFTISSRYSSLSVTLIITVRKFLSLLFSVIYFKNAFSLVHWVGTGLVFAGTLLFTDLGFLKRQKEKLR